jgi:hypothetical protein
MLPNFLVIGAPRAGTTWIAKNLSEHPSVFVPFKKEIHFFDSHYDRGQAFYESFFDDAGQAEAVGEATPAYLHKPEVAERLHAMLPNARLIVSLRNPVERVYSRYWKSRGRYSENENLTFEEKLASKPLFIEEGFYIDHLERYLALFPREQMLFLFFDDLKSNPERFMADIYRFIGVDETFKSALVDHQINAGAGQKLLVRSQAAFWTGRACRYIGLHGLAQWLEKSNAAELPPMAESTRRKLIETYSEKNRRLAELTGRDLSHWNEF